MVSFHLLVNGNTSSFSSPPRHAGYKKLTTGFTNDLLVSLAVGYLHPTDVRDTDLNLFTDSM